MLRCLDLSRAELSIAITDDREIRELNKVFRHHDRATDVLAFAMREEPLGTARTAPAEVLAGEMLGDVVVSVETARRQANQRRRPLDAEMRLLLAHGLLHLVGYDHQSDAEEATMTAETERLCRAAHVELADRGGKRASSGSKAGTSKSGTRRRSKAGARVQSRSGRAKN